MINKITFAPKPKKISSKLWKKHEATVRAWLAQTQDGRKIIGTLDAADRILAAPAGFSPASTRVLAAALPITLPPGYGIFGDPVARKVVDFGDMYGKALYEQYNLVPGANHLQEEQRNDGSWLATGTEIEGPADGGFWTMGAAIIEDDLLRDYYRLRVELP